MKNDNITSVGDAIKEILPQLEATQAKLRVFKQELIEKMAALEPEKCIDHPNQVLQVDESETYSRSWKNKSFTVKYKGCSECLRERREASEKDKWITLGIPRKLLHATFENFDTIGNEMKAKAAYRFKQHVKLGSGFIVALGKCGTGKSHLAAATIRRVGSGIFVTEHDLIGELRQTYTDNSGQDAMVHRYRSAKVLVLDELTPDVKGTDISPLLYRVLGYRHDNDLLTVITSNDDLKTVKEILGPKLDDRMRESCTIVNFVWESNRKPQQQL